VSEQELVEGRVEVESEVGLPAGVFAAAVEVS